jgi:hypothetical protein
MDEREEIQRLLKIAHSAACKLFLEISFDLMPARHRKAEYHALSREIGALRKLLDGWKAKE